MYLTIKTIHITLVALSFVIFLCRGIMMLMQDIRYRHKLFRIIPPIIDTMLLASGVSLMFIVQQFPTTQAWLGVKLIALIIYIILGIIALNRVNNYKLQAISFVAALTTIIFMISVARLHHPLGFLFYLLN